MNCEQNKEKENRHACDTRILNTWDSVTNQRIRELDPRIQQAAAEFINAAERELGITLRIADGFRDYPTQERYFREGKSKARAGESPHNFGLAIDVVPIENGRARYDTARWPEIGALGNRFGFNWSGDWKNFKELNHFDMHWDWGGKRVAQPRFHE